VRKALQSKLANFLKGACVCVCAISKIDGQIHWDDHDWGQPVVIHTFGHQSETFIWQKNEEKNYVREQDVDRPRGGESW
jgi:hypothetical protein